MGEAVRVCRTGLALQSDILSRAAWYVVVWPVHRAQHIPGANVHSQFICLASNFDVIASHNIVKLVAV